MNKEEKEKLLKRFEMILFSVPTSYVERSMLQTVFMALGIIEENPAKIEKVLMLIKFVSAVQEKSREKIDKEIEEAKEKTKEEKTAEKEIQKPRKQSFWRKIIKNLSSGSTKYQRMEEELEERRNADAELGGTNTSVYDKTKIGLFLKHRKIAQDLQYKWIVDKKGGENAG